MHRLAEETQRRITEDAANHRSQDMQNHTAKKSTVQEEVTALRKSLLETTTPNRESEQKLRKVV